MLGSDSFCLMAHACTEGISLKYAYVLLLFYCNWCSCIWHWLYRSLKWFVLLLFYMQLCSSWMSAVSPSSPESPRSQTFCWGSTSRLADKAYLVFLLTSCIASCQIKAHIHMLVFQLLRITYSKKQEKTRTSKLVIVLLPELPFVHVIIIPASFHMRILSTSVLRSCARPANEFSTPAGRYSSSSDLKNLIFLYKGSRNHQWYIAGVVSHSE